MAEREIARPSGTGREQGRGAKSEGSEKGIRELKTEKISANKRKLNFQPIRLQYGSKTNYV